MALKVILESLDDVEDPIRGEYREREIPRVGKRFVLDLEGVDDHPAVRNLKTAHEAAKADKIKLATRVEELEAKVEGLPDDFDPAEFARLKAEEDERARNPDDRTGEKEAALQSQKKVFEDRIEALRKKHDKDIKAKDAEIASLDGNLRETLVEDGLTKALVAVGVRKELLKAAKAMLQRSAVVKVDEGTGRRTALLKTDLGEEPIEDYVRNWIESDEGKAFVVPPSGGDAPGGRGNGARFTDNPWDSSGGKKPNLTKQQDVQVENPERARQMATAAGLKPGDLNWPG